MGYMEAMMQDKIEGAQSENEALRDEVGRLRAQLAVSTRGLKHCAGWNISDDKRAALMAVVTESEAMLAERPTP